MTPLDARPLTKHDAIAFQTTPIVAGRMDGWQATHTPAKPAPIQHWGTKRQPHVKTP